MHADDEHEIRVNGLSRRAMLQRAASAAGAALAPGLLAACGGDQEPAPSARGEVAGTITMMNYPDWIGEGEIAAFEKRQAVRVKQVSGLTDGNAAAAAQVNRNRDAYDMTLANAALAGQLDAAGLVERVDLANVPNASRIAASFQRRYPWGVATDLGKVGIGYRRDLVKERITSWADLWRLAPRYSGKIVFVKFDADVLGAALKYKGFSVNSRDDGELAQARQALLDIKPHLRAFLPTDIVKPMLSGAAAITVTYDYDVAGAQAEEDAVEWVAPKEGMPGYLDGWLAIRGTDKLAAIERFMDFHLEPRQYANFINTLGVAYTIPEATPLVDAKVRRNPALRFDAQTAERVEFEGFLGEAVATRARIWEEVQAA